MKAIPIIAALLLASIAAAQPAHELPRPTSPTVMNGLVECADAAGCVVQRACGAPATPFADSDFAQVGNPLAEGETLETARTNSRAETCAVRVVRNDGTGEGAAANVTGLRYVKLHLRGDGGGGSATVAPSESFRDCDVCPPMVSLPAGSFLMGAPVSEVHSGWAERPQRTVSVSDFAASAYEVTFAEWDRCVAEGGCGGYSPRDRGWGRGDLPVIYVSWEDAQLYVEWLSRKTGQTYRLPTEAEWEYAARAGTTSPFHTGGTITPHQANFDGRYGYPDVNNGGGLFRGQNIPVGSFAPNAFGLYDVHGNVWELVQDCYGNYGDAPSDGSAKEVGSCSNRVLRGGSRGSEPRYLRSANRYRAPADYRGMFGFRVARTLAP